MRISSALILALGLAACGPEAGVPEGDTIACAIGPGAQFAQDCVLERLALEEGGEMLVIHHPGGGFRRFVRKSATLLPLDGADPLVAVANDPAGELEFTIAGDRYRMPASTASR